MSLRTTVLKWTRLHYNNIIHSIAFMPAFIAISFLLLSYCILRFDFSPFGKEIKAGAGWLSLKDAQTARTIASTIAGGIFSLLVFSFSMVMILLNQAASQMSNRILNSLIGNRFQQLVLGFYVGTIVYALFILSTIRSIDSGIYIPAISVYVLILLTIADIFLFIYFLHYITQSIKYEVIIDRIRVETLHSLEDYCAESFNDNEPLQADAEVVPALISGYYQGISQEEIIAFGKEHDLCVSIIPLRGRYIIKGTPVFSIQSGKELTQEMKTKCLLSIDFYNGQPINSNPYNGFHQLKEIAVKALSPGINDPGTALISVHALGDLFSFRLNHFPKTVFKDDDGKVRLTTNEESFENLFRDCFYPIWDYAREDRVLMQGLMDVCEQLETLAKHPVSLFEIQKLLQMARRAWKEIEGKEKGKLRSS